ncbi:MAG: glycosyltransferase family 2 protein [Planctomycetaceae bacterium]|nr:glycosyltransferase family 2 protein [Planctomycetaceae bacterium]
MHDQTCSNSNFEVLIVDDGSTRPMEASELLDQVDKPQSNFQLRIIRQVNSGPAAARNYGSREGKGDLLAFIDGDCEANANWLEKLLETSRQHPQALVGGLSGNAVHDNIFCVTNQLILDLVYDHYNADPDNAGFLASNNWLCQRDLFF